jgi:hypothetical protein
MRSIYTAAVLISTTASLAAAHETEFWWSYPGNFTETEDFGYDPDFEVCGTSCALCYEGANLL